MAESGPIRVYVAVGANIEPARNIREGLAHLARRVIVKAVSDVFRTPAINRPDQPDYLNAVIALETELDPIALKGLLRTVEDNQGRVRTGDTYASRTLDLDILLYGDRVFNEVGIVLPDPDITVRPFLAAGLLELDPSLTLPGDGRRLSECMDPAVLAALEKDGAFTRELKESLHYES